MKRIRILFRTMVALAVGMTLAAAPASIASAAPSDPSVTAASDDSHLQPNFTLPHKVGEYFVPFTFTDKNGKVVKLSGYPSGCGLAVLLFRNGNILTGSMTTSCSFRVNSIEHNVYLYRSRFFGWERLITHEGDYSYNVGSKATTIKYDCTGTGTHDFRVEGYGYVSQSGNSYNASAYDEIDGVTC